MTKTSDKNRRRLKSFQVKMRKRMLRGKGGLIGIQPDLDNLLNANSVWELSPKWRGFLEWEGILEREGPEKPLPDDSWKEER